MPRKNANFRGMSSSPCQKSTNSFSKENNVDFPEATRAGRRMLAGRALLKARRPPRIGQRTRGANCRCTSCTDSRAADAQGALDRWGTCAGDRKRPLRTGRTLDREGRGNRRLGARPREGRRLFHPSIPKTRHGRPRAGRTPGFSEARTRPRRFRLSAGAGRNGGATLALRAFLCHAAAAQKRGAKRRRAAARPGTDAPGRSREDLSTKLPT